LREIFRKLASALHPDRETDAAEREAKTALMQRVNQAYAASDLLTLLELQLQIEQIDASHIASASAARLKHYNKIMAEQLAELRGEITRMEMGWKMEFGISPFADADPRRLMKVLQESERQWRAHLASMQRDVRRLANAAATKQWLKGERRRCGMRGISGRCFFEQRVPLQGRLAGEADAGADLWRGLMP
jgi:hypothetical protein